MGPLVLLLLSVLPPREIAAIERDQQKAQAAVTAKYGNKKPEELTGDERRAQARDLAEAQREVLEKHKVEAREWAVSQSRQSREDREEVKKEGQALAEQEKAEEAQKKAAEGGERPVVVQRGFNDENPVVLEEVEPGQVQVEKGLPAEAKADQDLAAEQDKLEGGAGESKGAAPAPSKQHGRGRK
jgi:hypothetical protein